MRPYLEQPFIKIGVVESLKAKALSSRPSTAKKKKERKKKGRKEGRKKEKERKKKIWRIFTPVHLKLSNCLLGCHFILCSMSCEIS
jgi:hypothetical protein